LYIKAPKRELYDESADPEALKNLAPSAQAITDTLDSQLSTFWTKTSYTGEKRLTADPTVTENLRALGYLASDNGRSNNETAEIDPKDKIGFINKLHDILADLEGSRLEEASAGLRELCEGDPADAGTANLEFGRALLHQARYAEALPVLRIAVEKMPNSSLAHYELGVALAKLGQWDAAVPELQAAVKAKPSSAQLHFDLAIAYTHLKQSPEAEQEYEQTLQLDPDHFQANLSYGRLLLLQGHPEAALTRLSHAVELDPESVEAHGFLAVTYQRLGQPRDAERERTRAEQLKAQSENSPK